MNSSQPNGELAWGHDYLMVEPDHFRVDYSINPFMDLDDQHRDGARVRRPHSLTR